MILMDKEQLKYVIKEQERQALPKLVSRPMDIPYDAGKIVSLIGMRRVGKTYLLFQRMQELLALGIDPRLIIYLNFEDDRLAPVRPEDFALITTAHGELYPELHGEQRYYFFDEVQNAPGWERFCRRLYDTEKAAIVVTGSSSQFLAREVATELRGRSLPIEVFPLSFEEFLLFRGIELEPSLPSSEQLAFSELESYLRIGGLPEVVLAEEAVRSLILREYSDLVFYKDLVDRHKLGNPTLMKELLRHCLSAPASLLNVAKLFNDLKSRGLKIGKDSVYRYLDILQEAYIIFLLPVIDRSLRKRSINPKKMHLIDWSIGYAYSPRELVDRGRRLENAVFLHSRRRYPELGYVATPYEVDLVETLEGPRRYINVCWSISSSETRERKVRALKNIMVEGAERILVTHEGLPNSAQCEGLVVVPAWKYLLLTSPRCLT